MTELSQMIRWNTGFIRGLAQSVLERAKNVRVSLDPAKLKSKVKVKPAKRKTVKPKKKPVAAASPARRKAKKKTRK